MQPPAHFSPLFYAQKCSGQSLDWRNTTAGCYPEPAFLAGEGSASRKSPGKSRFLAPFKRRTGLGMTCVGTSLRGPATDNPPRGFLQMTLRDSFKKL